MVGPPAMVGAGQPKFPQRGPWGPPYRAPGSKLGELWLAGGPTIHHTRYIILYVILLGIFVDPLLVQKWFPKSHLTPKENSGN